MSAVGGNREIGDRGVFGLAAAVAHHDGVGVTVCQLDRVERLGERPDLVDLDEDRVGDCFVDTHLETTCVGDEQVVADQLTTVADRVGQRLPPGPVILGHSVFDRDHRIRVDDSGPVLHQLVGREHLALTV